MPLLLEDPLTHRLLRPSCPMWGTLTMASLSFRAKTLLGLSNHCYCQRCSNHFTCLLAGKHQPAKSDLLQKGPIIVKLLGSSLLMAVIWQAPFCWIRKYRALLPSNWSWPSMGFKLELLILRTLCLQPQDFPAKWKNNASVLLHRQENYGTKKKGTWCFSDEIVIAAMLSLLVASALTEQQSLHGADISSDIFTAKELFSKLTLPWSLASV